MHLRYCTIDATKLTADRHEASHGLFATAELVLKVIAQKLVRQKMVGVPIVKLLCHWHIGSAAYAFSFGYS